MEARIMKRDLSVARQLCLWLLLIGAGIANGQSDGCSAAGFAESITGQGVGWFWREDV